VFNGCHEASSNHLSNFFAFEYQTTIIHIILSFQICYKKDCRGRPPYLLGVNPAERHIWGRANGAHWRGGGAAEFMGAIFAKVEVHARLGNMTPLGCIAQYTGRENT
jgi:hypothetical protein